MAWFCAALVAVGFSDTPLTTCLRAAEVIPHGQSSLPGPALSPEQALAKMTVPAGFTVELVASEPELVNPVAMTFDERGRIWVTESLEYPRRSPGPGRDRIKVLEDTDRDGKVDKVTLFAEGLNIPSGIAVGYGGVWVANAPDILFLQDTDGDGQADKSQVVVTGFGRDDTHELPNSLTWGPDGFLYGLNGVFNRSVVRHRGREFDFTCALFRINPRTWDFELFAEGTSNPWGVAWNQRGDAFLSACVIDHLWHLTESGYYHRQGGPYPPFTWKIDSIVAHKHQQAAYCGIHYFDSDAYPEAYRGRLYMGNIHGNCINVDELEDRGATYFARPNADFLSAHDAWFMPVVQKTGPDGCLYVLDWYDRYHCYQDANRDPEGIDRGRGRLYRIRYQNSPRAEAFDLTKESDSQLMDRLRSPNVFYRDLAQRLLAERNGRSARPVLQQLVLDDGESKKTRMHALWALIGGGDLEPKFHEQLLSDRDEDLRAWAVRAAGNAGQVEASLLARIQNLAGDSSPRVRMQVAIAARKLKQLEPLPLLLDVLNHSADDPLIPHIVWQNLHPLLEQDLPAFLPIAKSVPADRAQPLASLMPRVVDRILAIRNLPPQQVAELFQLVTQGSLASQDSARSCLEVLRGRAITGELPPPQLESLGKILGPSLRSLIEKQEPLSRDAALLAATWRDDLALREVRELFADAMASIPPRARALEVLLAAGDEQVAELAVAIIGQSRESFQLREAGIAALARDASSGVGQQLVELLPHLEPELQPRVVEVLTGRADWAKELLAAIAAAKVPANLLNVNQVRKLLSANNPELLKLVSDQWGSLRTQRDPAREELIERMRAVVLAGPGDPLEGQKVFAKVCGQCHKIYGQGEEVGPDITQNGRSSFEQLLSNVFDPSLVIGTGYQATIVVTKDGRVLTGLLVEDSAQRVQLKIQGGKVETIPRDNVETQKLSELSLMPEGLENQLTEKEITDLFAYITLDRPPTDPAAKRLPGSVRVADQESTTPDDFTGLVAQVLPGWTLDGSGVGGVAVLSRYRGQPTVLRTHPVSRQRASQLTRQVAVPAAGHSRLSLAVSSDERGDWLLRVAIDGELAYETVVSNDAATDGWREIAVDLTPYAGKTVTITLSNEANGWDWEHGYWSRAEVITEP